MMQYVKFHLLFTLIFSISSSLVAAEELVPAIDLFQAATESGFLLSPDEKHLAYVKRQYGQYYVNIYHVKKREVIHKVPIGLNYPSALTWLNNRRLMYQRSGSLIAFNKDGSDKRKILDFWGGEFKWLGLRNRLKVWELLDIMLDDDEKILVSALGLNDFSSVYEVDIYTGEKDEIVSGAKNKVHQWLVNRRGDVVMGVRHKRDSLEFLIKDKDSGKYKVQDKLDEAGEFSLDYNGASFMTRRVILQGLSDNEDILYVSENIGRNYFRLSEYSISQNKVVKPIYEDSHYDVGSLHEPLQLFYSRTSKELLGVRYLKSALSTAWFNPVLQSVQTKIDKHYGDKSVILDWASDLSFVLVAVRSDQHWGDVYLYYPETGESIQQGGSSHSFADYALPNTKVVHYQSKDGTAHESYLTLPADYKAGTLPTIIMPHGGPWVRYAWGYDPEAVYFASRGYAVLRTNYRGSSGFGRQYFIDGYQSLAEVMLDDIADGAKWMLQEGYANPDKVFIMGTSYGGYAALMSTIRYPDLYKGAVSLAAPLNIVSHMQKLKGSKSYFAYDVWVSAVGDPKKKKTDVKRMSPHFQIKKLTTPYIIFHGKEDSNVSVDQVEAFQKQMKKHGHKHKVRIIQDEGHGFHIAANQVYYVESVDRFFKGLVQ